MKAFSQSESAPPTPETIAEWREMIKNTNGALNKMLKQADHQRQRQQVERAVVEEEMRSELVSREANSARTAERYRILSERMALDDSSVSVFDRALSSCAMVETGLAALCHHVSTRSPGVQPLMEQAEASQKG